MFAIILSFSQQIAIHLYITYAKQFTCAASPGIFRMEFPPAPSAVAFCHHFSSPFLSDWYGCVCVSEPGSELACSVCENRYISLLHKYNVQCQRK